MKVKNSIQVEPLPTGGIPRIFVSYYSAIMEIGEYNLASRLITDLQAVGIDVLADEIQDINIPPTEQLQSYDWILLVQTKDVASVALVKERLAKALNQDGKQHVQRILHVRVSASQDQTTIPNSDMYNTFDASIDYPRAFARIVLTIHPDYRTRLYGIEREAPASAMTPHNSFSGIITDSFFRSRRVADLRHPLYILFIVLTILILLGIIVIHSFTLSSTKTTPTKITATKITPIKLTPTKITTNNHHTNPPAMTPQEALYMRITRQTPVINDSLQRQSANQWNVMQQQGASCAFTNGSYHISILPPSQASRRYVCLAQGHAFANLTLQVDLKLLQGDVGGMIFRANGLNAYTWFSLDTHGCYRLVVLAAGGQIHILSNDQHSCLTINMRNTNQLTAIAQGSNIYLYIDGRFINQFPDPSFTKGEVGLMAIKRTQSTVAAFSNLKVWQ